MSSLSAPPADRRSVVAIDLGAESCRVSMLEWSGDHPSITLIHRFANAPTERDGGLRWDLHAIEAGVEHGLRACAERAAEGIASIGVDGWAVDYVLLDGNGHALTDPFCYRDERTLEAEPLLYRHIPPERLRQITGVQLLRINTLFQIFAEPPCGPCPPLAQPARVPSHPSRRPAAWRSAPTPRTRRCSTSTPVSGRPRSSPPPASI